MRIRPLVALAVLAVALVFSNASAALAKPVPWESVDLVVNDDQGTQLMILAGQLATDTPLPAEVELAVPAGLQLQWGGEILGGDPSADPAVTPKITKVGGSDVYSFTLNKSRVAQLELVIPGAVRLVGSTYAAAVTWTPSQNVKQLTIGFRIPAGAQVATPVQGAVEVPGPAGFDYYRSTLTNLKAGQPVTFAFDYTAPATAGSSGATSSGTTATFAIIAVLGAIVAALGYAIWRKMQSRSQVAAAAGTAGAKTSARSGTKPAARASAPANSASKNAPKPVSAANDAGRAGRSKAGFIVMGVVVAVVIGGFLAVQSSTKPQDQGDVITRTFSSADPCTSTVVPLAVAANSDMSGAAEKLFGVLQSLPSITTAKVYKDQPRIEVGYCESTLKPGQVEQALAETGLVAKPQ